MNICNKTITRRKNMNQMKMETNENKTTRANGQKRANDVQNK